MITIRQVEKEDVTTVSSILQEAATWLEQKGMPLWKRNELSPEKIVTEVESRLFWLAMEGEEPVGTFKFQWEDELFWPECPKEEAAYLHRIAIKRRVAGKGVSTAIMDWAACRTKESGRCFLRLDCAADRLSLRKVYEQFGFRHHSDKKVGPYLVSRYELNVWAKP